MKKQTTELRLVQEKVVRLETSNTKLQLEKDVLEVSSSTGRVLSTRLPGRRQQPWGM